MINETNLSCFLSVAETRNFTESARRLFLTQQAVSKNVMQLEQDLGINLIDRSNRSVSLTPEGERYRELILHLREVYDSEMNLIRMLSRNQENNVDICCQNFIDLGAGLKRAIDKAKSQNPELAVRISRLPPGELIRRLFDAQTNIIIMYERYAPAVSGGYVKNDLFQTRTAILVSANHPNVKPEASCLDFQNDSYIVDIFPGESENAAQQRAKRECQNADIDPSEIILVLNRESAYITAELGSGILLGTDISMIPPCYNIVRYRTDASESICCIYKSVPGSATDRLASCLKEAYLESH